MNIALILAGGTGTRLGSDIPKQYIEVCGKPIISFCLETFFSHENIDAVQIVADEMWHEYISERISSNKFMSFSTPGATRQLSIYNGLCDIKKYSSDDDRIIIHDAARPLVSSEIITACFEALNEHDCVLPVLPMKDTVYSSEDGRCISGLVERSKIYAGQAPEAFILGKYLAANEILMPDKILKINGSTEPAVIAGLDVALIDGDEKNFKITTKTDLEKFKEYIKL